MFSLLSPPRSVSPHSLTFHAALISVLTHLTCTVAFAQGKLQFATDSLHLVYYDASTGPLAGSAVSSANMPGGVTLVADLYAGTAPESLSLVSTTSFGAAPGKWTVGGITFGNLPGDTAAWFQVQVRDNSFSNATAAAEAGGYSGFSQVFSAVPQASSLNPIYQTTSPVFCTWEPGTFNLDNIALGFRGAIPVGINPTSPPTVLVNPVSRTVPAGAFVKFEVEAQGYPPLGYQWLYGSNLVSGGTNSRLMLTNVQPSQSGVYQVLVTNSGGSVTSQPADLSVLTGLDIHMLPAIALLGGVGLTYRLDFINAFGSVTNWVPLATITITNTGQLYLDFSAIGQPQRFYRLVQLP